MTLSLTCRLSRLKNTKYFNSDNTGHFVEISFRTIYENHDYIFAIVIQRNFKFYKISNFHPKQTGPDNMLTVRYFL